MTSLALLLGLAALPANDQDWTVIFLEIPRAEVADWALTYHVKGTRIVGYGITPAGEAGFIWDQGTEMPTLRFGPTSSTRLLASHGNQVGGYVSRGSDIQAAIFGEQGEFVGLAPRGSTFSKVMKMSSGRQGGVVRFGSTQHAALWQGTADSWQSLNPPGVSVAAVQGMTEDIEVGWITRNGAQKACLWKGSPESFLSLHPEKKKYGSSVAFGVNGDQQVGRVSVAGPGSASYASLWRGMPSRGLIFTQPSGPTQ